MKFHRLPRALEYMGDFWLPPLPGRDPSVEQPEPGQHKKRDTASGRFVKLTRKERRKVQRKEKARKQARAALMRELHSNVKPKAPSRGTCYSATCIGCGRVWLSAIRPIKPNTEGGYLCSNCR